jgi:hypothetical protein
MRRFWLVFLGLCFGASGVWAWIDYDERVPAQTPAFGKAFAGFALKLSTAESEFELDAPQAVDVTLKNLGSQADLLAKAAAEETSQIALYVVLADANGVSRFSENLLTGKERFTVGETPLAQPDLQRLSLRRVDGFKAGWPVFEAKYPAAATTDLTPGLYSLRAILLAGRQNARPDAVLASNTWAVLLRPKSGSRMAAAEKQAKLARYLKDLQRDAYGGQRVSSQLAALGELAVDPLIAVADRAGGDKVRESRIWATITLCNISSNRAAAYIERRLRHPVDLGDLAFLAWHSQACHDEQVDRTLRKLMSDVLEHRRLSWQDDFPSVPEGAKMTFLEFACKHYARTGKNLDAKQVAAALRLPDPKPVAFALAAWKPESAPVAIDTVKEMFARRGVHPNLQRAILHALNQVVKEPGFPGYQRERELSGQWLEAGIWLGKRGSLTSEQQQSFGVAQALSLKDPVLQRQLVLWLAQLPGTNYPVEHTLVTLPEDWIATWRWALKVAQVPKDEAVRFLCDQMRTRVELPDAVKRALLLELAPRLGPAFPLPATPTFDLETVWPQCGRWLVEQGYFKTKG